MDSQVDKDKKQKYEKDEREVCKYGSKCYQKNPAHHKKFKHPPKKENENKEVIGKKRKSPEDAESSLSNTSKVKKLETPSTNKDSGREKTETLKEDENVTKDEANSSEVTKDEAKSSDVKKVDSEDVTKNDSTTSTDQVMSDVTETGTDKKAGDKTTDKVTSDATDTKAVKKTGNNETETPNKTNDINSPSNAKDNEEKMDTEEDSKVEVKSKDDAVDKETETKVDNIEKSTENKSKEQKTKEDSKTLNNEGKISGSVKLNTEAKNSKAEVASKAEAKSSNVKAEAASKAEVKNSNLKAQATSKAEARNSNIKAEVARGDYTEVKRLIQKAFLVPMPNDFYKFYEFCKDTKPVEPSTALKIAELKLVGPYDVLSGLITKEIVDNTDLLSHWRYYYDPPEFQTVIKGNDKEGLHFGYWRDRPSSDPVFVATNCSNVSHKIKPIAENIFGAIAYYLEERSKKVTPFEKTGFSSLIGKLKSFAKKHNISLELQSDKMKSREKNVVARTIHGAGIVCPYNKKTQLGYRELSVTDNQLLKIVKKIDDAQNDEERMAARAELGEVVRLATIAGDECDFGTCLELGHDLLSTGCFHVQNAALAVLSIAYNQLDRQAFLKIVESHLKNRKKSSNPSALENVSKE